MKRLQSNSFGDLIVVFKVKPLEISTLNENEKLLIEKY